MLHALPSSLEQPLSPFDNRHIHHFPIQSKCPDSFFFMSFVPIDDTFSKCDFLGRWRKDFLDERDLSWMDGLFSGESKFTALLSFSALYIAAVSEYRGSFLCLPGESILPIWMDPCSRRKPCQWPRVQRHRQSRRLFVGRRGVPLKTQCAEFQCRHSNLQQQKQGLLMDTF